MVTVSRQGDSDLSGKDLQERLSPESYKTPVLSFSQTGNSNAFCNNKVQLGP